MWRDGVEGMTDGWSGAPEGPATKASPPTRARMKRIPPEPPSVDPEERRAEIAQWRAERKPLPPKSKSQQRKDVGRQLHQYDSDLCGICNTPIDMALLTPHPGSLQLDHIHPRAGLGGDSWDNIQIAHGFCNGMKSDFIEGHPSAERAADELHIAIAHWEDRAQLEADYRAVSDRIKGHRIRWQASLDEREEAAESDPLLKASREAEHFSSYRQWMEDEKLQSRYLHRLISHRRRAPVDG
jgi:5-methylcytosine-specific restriction endonuclease McrA